MARSAASQALVPSTGVGFAFGFLDDPPDRIITAASVASTERSDG